MSLILVSINLLALLEAASTDIVNFDSTSHSSKWDGSSQGSEYFTSLCELLQQKCNKIPNDVIMCSDCPSVSILTCHCVTYWRTERTFEVGKCIFNMIASLEYPYPYKQLTVTEDGIETTTCTEFNRAGTLCGKCMDGYYPLVNSFDLKCIQCPNGKSNWWKFVLAAFLPLTIFYFIILLFKISVVSSQFHGFVIYSQAIAMPSIAHAIYNSNTPQYSILLTLFKAATTLYGIWNLDFFRFVDFNICLGTDTLQTLALDLAVGIYPFLLMLLSYILISLYDRNFRLLVVIWKPFHKIFGHFQQNWNVKTSLIDVFVTFILLSSIKFLSVSHDLLAPVKVYQLNSAGNLSISWRLYFDANVPYLGERHIPYAILAISVLTLFILLPSLLLIVYPFRWFQKLLNIVPIRWYVLHTFMDSLAGHYKDGTQPGTHDCRWFASVWFIIRILMVAIGAGTHNLMFFPLAATSAVAVVILLINLEPFKENHHTITNGVFTLAIALTYTTAVGLRATDYNMLWPLRVAALSFVLPLLYVTALTLHWMYRQRRFTNLKQITLATTGVQYVTVSLLLLLVDIVRQYMDAHIDVFKNIQSVHFYNKNFDTVHTKMNVF